MNRIPSYTRDPVIVREAFSEIIQSVDEFIIYLESNDSITFQDFMVKKGPINLALIKSWSDIDYLTVTDKKYSKIFEEIRKILLSLTTDLNNMEKKHLGTGWLGMQNLMNWEFEYRKGKFRKVLINYYKKTSKKLRKIHNKI